MVCATSGEAELEAALPPKCRHQLRGRDRAREVGSCVAREECDNKDGGLRKKCIEDAKAALVHRDGRAKAVAAKAL
jgi:hypothetical protein